MADPRSPATQDTRARYEAEAAAAGLPPLLVAAERVAATVEQGVHGRRRVGLGETFWQFRRYQPGDAMRSIDWRQTAKSDRVFVRETEWAAAQSAWLWRDRSSSMNYASDKKLPEKGHRADILLLALAALMSRAGERIALLGSGQKPGSGKVALDTVALNLLRGPADAPDRSVPGFESLPRYSSLILFGDFLGPLDEINQIVRRYAARGVRGHLVQVLDPAELTLPFKGRTRFEGMENEGKLLVKRVENIRDDYTARLEDHQRGLADLTRAAGWQHLMHRTDHPPERMLMTLYLHLAEGVL